MKKYLLVVIALVLVSPDIFAVSGKDRWSDIRKSREVLIQQPAFAQVFGPHGLFNACATEDEFRSLTPVKNCRDCAPGEEKIVTLSRNFVRDTCMRESFSEGCVEFSTREGFYPDSFYLPVIEGARSEDFVFSKRFTLPACE